LGGMDEDVGRCLLVEFCGRLVCVCVRLSKLVLALDVCALYMPYDVLQSSSKVGVGLDISLSISIETTESSVRLQVRLPETTKLNVLEEQ
jgi:hypothetical protein